MHFYVRTSATPEQLLPDDPAVVRELDPNLPVEDLQTMAQQVRENVFLDRMISTLSAAFAVLATLLAAVGLYGVLAYTVAQRTREIGLRMALGAAPNRVRAMVLRQVGVMTLVGGTIGLMRRRLGRRAAKSMLFRWKGTIRSCWLVGRGAERSSRSAPASSRRIAPRASIPCRRSDTSQNQRPSYQAPRHSQRPSPGRKKSMEVFLGLASCLFGPLGALESLRAFEVDPERA